MDKNIFRAKIINDTKIFDEYELKNGQYVFGYLQKTSDKNYIWTQETYRYEVDEKTVSQFTGYYMFEIPVFFGDKVSNNYGTDKEVVREVVEYEGCKMLKRIKGKSRMPEFISLHEHHALNYRVIN